jgi:hypothetical protein
MICEMLRRPEGIQMCGGVQKVENGEEGGIRDFLWRLEKEEVETGIRGEEQF